VSAALGARHGGDALARVRRGVRALAAGVLVFLVHAYRVGLSPHLAGSCRYAPSCSTYALEAVRVHGPWRGATLAVGRVLRCHPFRPGGIDPVPEAAPAPHATPRHRTGVPHGP
jgi:putative membrane protein insertion efficiency factor